ncbi:MAG: hypothetical protein HC892_06960 [Saprospiraceae bacterium]|nr:hypothetical protein [Saprospiraceae bacterium]
MLDTASSIEAVRQLGYDQQYGFKPYFFEHPVDFYGKIFLRCDSISWLQQNALDDLVQTRHHRVFYYLSLKLYQSVLDHPRYNYTPEELSDKIQALIGARIRIHDSQQQLVLEPNWLKDKQGSLNFLIYWMTHHEDYEWDASRKQFINKTISLTLTNTYKNSLQRLTSSNDSVAWSAYLLLTEGKSEEIVALTDRYRPALYNHNKSLPPIESYYLEQLVLLTEFCKRNNIIYKPRENIAKSLDSLSMKLSPPMRYRLEKKLLNQLQINDLTALEYYACLKAASLEFSYSMGWLLDKAYSQFWKDIASSESQLRIFLKKSYLFSRLGTAGICNLYLKKPCQFPMT